MNICSGRPVYSSLDHIYYHHSLEKKELPQEPSMQSTAIEQYQAYADKIGNRKALYNAVAKKYHIQTALYPGSHIDIAPSLVIPDVTYVDNFKGAVSFFDHMKDIADFIELNKEYDSSFRMGFEAQDYTRRLFCKPVDLIISQYAGFVVQATKHLLNGGGIALCNDSHGDATLTNFDDDFAFIGIVDSKHRIHTRNLDDYFEMAKGKPLDLERVWEKMQGPKYEVVAENYLFRKIQ